MVSEREAVKVRDAIAIGDKKEAASIRRPLWIHVLALVEGMDSFDVPGCRIEQRKAVLPKMEYSRIAAEAVRDEGNAASIRRPRWLQIGKGIISESAQAGLSLPRQRQSAFHHGSRPRPS